MSKAPANALEFTIGLRWSDQDLMGHVNNARIMTLLEEARIRAMDAFQQQIGANESLGSVVRTANTDFLLPVNYPSDVVVRVWISRIGNTSYVMQHELSQHDTVCVTLEAIMVLFSSATQKPTPISDTVRAALESVSA